MTIIFITFPQLKLLVHSCRRIYHRKSIQVPHGSICLCFNGTTGEELILEQGCHCFSDPHLIIGDILPYPKMGYVSGRLIQIKDLKRVIQCLGIAGVRKVVRCESATTLALLGIWDVAQNRNNSIKRSGEAPSHSALLTPA